MADNNRKQATYERSARMLRTALGPAISNLLLDKSIVEVMLNPDGRIWVDRRSEGLEDTGERLTPEDGERIIPPGRPSRRRRGACPRPPRLGRVARIW